MDLFSLQKNENICPLTLFIRILLYMEFADCGVQVNQNNNDKDYGKHGHYLLRVHGNTEEGVAVYLDLINHTAGKQCSTESGEAYDRIFHRQCTNTFFFADMFIDKIDTSAVDTCHSDTVEHFIQIG